MARVMVVEDDPDIALLIAHKLRSAGHEVAVVGDGAAAIVAIRSSHPDLIILDWMLPGLNGIEIATAVRADDDLQGTPILMLTAKAQDADVERGFAAGADDYLQKPFSPRELVARVERLLARRRP